MMQYKYQRIGEELQILKEIYQRIYSTWNDPEDHEDLYRIRIPLLVLATLARTITLKKIQVKILSNIRDDQNPRDLKFKEKDLLGLNNRDNFKNKVENLRTMTEVCNYLIHDLSSGYADTCTEINQTNDFKIYYCVATDNKPEIMIDIEEFIKKIEQLIAQKK